MNILDFFRPYPVRKSGIVNLKHNGASFRGVIWQIKGPFLVLRNTEILDQGGPRPLDGEIILQMADIEFIQVT